MNNYAFIDSQNLNLGVKADGWNLNFEKFRNYLRTKYKVKKAFLFLGYVAGNESMYQNLQNHGFILIFKPVIAINEKGKQTYKGNVDAELVLHIMIEFDNYDKAIVVTGDGDFHCVVEHLAEKQKLYKIITPNRKYSSLLRKHAGYILTLSSVRNKLEYKRGK